MIEFFAALLRMSAVAALCAVVVMLLRAVLKKLGAPRLIVFLLWAVVLFRMVCPVSFESPAALISAAPLGTGWTHGVPAAPRAPSLSGQASIPVPDASGAAPAPSAPAAPSLPAAVSPPEEPDDSVMSILALICAGGVLALCGWTVFSYFRLKRRVRAAVKTADGAWETDRIDGPFVLGFFPPKTYLPLGLSGDTRSYVLLHERAHIRRGDHIVKAVAFLALAAHWFNPVLWLAWALACRDMEAVCDEWVLRHSAEDIRRGYSAALLSLAAARPVRVPLAFGENGVKGRIRGVLRWRRSVPLAVAVFALAALVLGFVLAADPAPLPSLPEEPPGLTVEFASSDTLELSPVLSHWDGADALHPRPDLDAAPYASGDASLDLHFTGAAPDEVTVTDYLLGDIAQPGRALDVSPYGGSGGTRYLVTLEPHPASVGEGWELRGFVVAARWRSGRSYQECQYGFQLLMPAQRTDAPRTAPFVTAEGTPIPVYQTEDYRKFPSVAERPPVEVPFGSLLTVFDPQTPYSGVYETRYLLAEDGSILSIIGSDGWVSIEGADPADSGGSFGVRTGTSEVGLIGVELHYTLPGGEGQVWRFTFRGGAPETPAPEWRCSDEDGAPYLRYPGAVDWTPVLPLLPLPAEWKTDAHAPAIDGVTSMEGVYGGCYMGFTSPDEGWLVLGGGGSMGTAWNYVYLTHDGGRTWIETGNPNGECLQVLCFAAFSTPEIGFLCYRYEWGGAPIYRTTDGGKTWELFELPLPAPGEAAYEVNFITFDGPNAVMDLTRHTYNGRGERVDTHMTFALSGYGTAYDMMEAPVFDANVDPYSLKASDLPTGPALSTKSAGYQWDRPVRLLAELPEEDISLYALNEYWLGTGGVLLVRDRDMSTARWYDMEYSVIMESASLHLGDYDGDGEAELAADFYLGHGTGISDHELAVFELEGRGFGARTVFDEAAYRPLALSALADLGLERYDRFGSWVNYEFDGDAITMTLAVQDDTTPPTSWAGALISRVHYDGTGFSLSDSHFSETF